MAMRRGRSPMTLVLVGLMALTAGCAAASRPAVVARVSPATSGSDDLTAEGSGPALYCPTRAPARVTAPNEAPKTEMPVPGAPVAALVCEYAGRNRPEPIGVLLAHHLVDRPSTLAVAVNDGPLFGPGPYSCPADDGSVDLLRFGYSGGTADDVPVRLRGCPAVGSTSFHTPMRWASPQLLLLLKVSAQ